MRTVSLNIVGIPRSNNKSRTNENAAFQSTANENAAFQSTANENAAFQSRGEY
jgi:hypothetical protein